MKLTNAMVEEIIKSCEKIEYGKVTICLSASARTIDIVTEDRKQFKKIEAGGPA